MMLLFFQFIYCSTIRQRAFYLQQKAYVEAIWCLLVAHPATVASALGGSTSAGEEEG
jgi:hypothetical protein